jgi:aspartate/methionine/tyrosine aminotransferase
MFSVRDDDPFVIFRKLQELARQERGEEDIIDLSRGDPGYGFTPSVRGREFASFVLLLDSILNESAEKRFEQTSKGGASAIWKQIEAIAAANYTGATGQHLITLLQKFIQGAVQMAKEERIEWNDTDIFSGLFRHSAMAGGAYLHPQGELLTRMVVAGWHRHDLGVKIMHSDLLLVNGASHAIGALFKGLGEEGCGFLQKGDAVCITSPVYAPYNRILEERGLPVLMLSIDPLTGKLKREDIEMLRKTETQVKVLFLIDPHNPTGFSLLEEELEELAAIAEKRNMLIITDEVYRSFFPKKKTMLTFAPDRTICINTRSKIERSTGLRFGEIIVLPEGRKLLSSLLGLENPDAFFKLFIAAKAPGRAGGQFQHTNFIPGPSQLLGIAHILLGEEERTRFLASMTQNRDVFTKTLGLPHQGNAYYIIFDLDTLAGEKTRMLPIEERLVQLAKKGVIYIPAYRFFAPADRLKPGALTSVRASMANSTVERIEEAARRTKQVLCENH